MLEGVCLFFFFFLGGGCVVVFGFGVLEFWFGFEW